MLNMASYFTIEILENEKVKCPNKLIKVESDETVRHAINGCYKSSGQLAAVSIGDTDVLDQLDVQFSILASLNISGKIRVSYTIDIPETQPETAKVVNAFDILKSANRTLDYLPPKKRYLHSHTCTTIHGSTNKL